MKHTVEILEVDIGYDANKDRVFTALIDSVRVKGIVKYIAKQIKPGGSITHQYRFYLPEGMTLHFDYKNIRRQLLICLIDKVDRMADKSLVVR